MTHLRFSVALLMAVAAVIALDVAVMRSLFRDAPGSNQIQYLVPIDGTTWIPFGTLAIGVLPVAGLLLLVAIFQLPKIWRTGKVSSFWLGFAISGSLAMFVFMIVSSCCRQAPPSGIWSWLVVCRPITPMAGMMGNEPPQWLEYGIELALATTLLVLPELLVATLGGWLLARAGNRTIIVQSGASAYQAGQTGRAATGGGMEPGGGGFSRSAASAGDQRSSRAGRAV